MPADKCEEWNRRIPRKGQLTTKHYVCDLHFEPHFMIKSDDFTINGKAVSIPRDRWALTPNAVPTLFPNLPQYLSKHVANRRVLKRHISAVDNDDPASKLKASEAPKTARVNVCNESGSSVSPVSQVNVEHCYASVTCSRLKVKGMQKHNVTYLKRRIHRQSERIRHLTSVVRKLERDNKTLKQQLQQYERLPEKMKTITSQAAQNSAAKSKAGHRYSDDWIVDSLLIRCKSSSAYRMLRDGSYLPLPSLSTLSRSIRSLRPEFGFNPNLFESLSNKLAAVNVNERRGILMFDEVQISKNVEFRIDTCKIVGMVDFGDLTSDEQQSTEGDHALVFMFQPHLSGWIQTVGCFCSAGTTQAITLSQLLLKCIILLQNSGAFVDAVVCDGAATNRSALAQLGFDGSLNSLSNKMMNPCDASRNVFFFCDMPHLLKTMRNNLLRAKQFQVQAFKYFFKCNAVVLSCSCFYHCSSVVSC